MRIAILGASGRTGTYLVKRALEAGHDVVAFARTTKKIGMTNERLTVVELDLAQDDAARRLAASLGGTDAIISTLGPDTKGKPAVMVKAAEAALSAAHAAPVNRLIWMTGAGVQLAGDPPSFVRSIVRGIMTLVAGEVLRDSEEAARRIVASDLDWTVVRAPMLNDEAPTGRLFASTVPPRPAALSRDEIAGFLLACATNARPSADGARWSRAAPFLSLGEGK